MRYAHIYSRLLSTPWFVDEATLYAITSLLQDRMNGGTGTRRLRAALLDPESEPEDDPAELPEVPGICVIDVCGVIGKHLSSMEVECGGCDMDRIRAQFDAAQADASVRAIVLYVNSPGGMAQGCHELFTHLMAAKQKPLYAFADVLCGSAAYYIASAADAIFCAPTARVGSIGSMLIVCDASQAYAAQGVKFTLVKSGEWKGLGDPRFPMKKEGLAHLQSGIDQLGAQFRADVSAARPSLAAEDMQGLAYFGREAVAKHLADELVLDLPTLLQRL